VQRCIKQTPPPPQRLDEVRSAAEDWLVVVPFEVREVRESIREHYARTLARTPGGTYLAVDSYPRGENPGQRERSYLYDNALGLIWFSWTGQEKLARGLARTLALLQLEDGAWGFSFSLANDGYYNARYVRTGAVAWAAYALAYYGINFEDEEALAAAHRAADFLVESRVRSPEAPHDGLIAGGRGCWPPGGTFTPDEPFAAAVTEHQFDAHMALASNRSSKAGALAARILEVLWLPAETRFAVAAGPDGVNPARALDAAGALGALWLMSVGETELARQSLLYTARAFRVTDHGLAAYRPYLDPVDGPLRKAHERLIFSEGTFALGLAAHRVEEEELARQILHFGAQLACIAGPGMAYANQNLEDFAALPAAASTFWFLFLEREIRTGQQAPLFPQVSDLVAPDESGPTSGLSGRDPHPPHLSPDLIHPGEGSNSGGDA